MYPFLRSDIARVSFDVVEAATNENNTITLDEDLTAEVYETDPVGHLVVLITASNEDNNPLFYDIVEGNDRNDFSISRDKGSLLIANPLNYAEQPSYELTVKVTDGLIEEFTKVHIKVVRINEEGPQFVSPDTNINIPESVQVGTNIGKLPLKNPLNNSSLFYAIHNAQNADSLEIFNIDSNDGTLYLARSLDREIISQHILTVSVKKQGSLVRHDYTRAVINVEDNNDHSPQFLSQLIQTKLFETAEIGSAVVQALAVDNDFGDNGVISYSILSGNVGNAFTIDTELGILRVARELNMRVQPEYMLMLKATDHGLTPLSATVPVHILLTMADTAPPRFLEPDYATEVYENLPRGHFVIHVEARSQSSLFYEIIDGNHGSAFQINPSTGIIMTRQALDFETVRVYNLTIQASNMVGVKSTVMANIHILDVNDNPPRFVQHYFEGSVSENTQIGSLVLVNHTTPLVLEATDADSGTNSLLMFEILEDLARQYFTVDSSTGAVRTIQNLDYEAQKQFEFDVKVSDMGKPRLSAETIAHVKISLRDENDCPPVFDQQFYNIDLLLPTFTNVTVHTVHATDPDLGVKTVLKYKIVSGNMDDIFGIDTLTGRIFVQKPDIIDNNPRYSLDIQVSDGKFTSKSTVNLTVKKSENSGLAFGKSKYYTTVLENSTKSDVILVVNVLGSALNENLEFKILNPTDMFMIGETSGALATTGVPFDREEKENYELVLQVTSQGRGRQNPR